MRISIYSRIISVLDPAIKARDDDLVGHLHGVAGMAEAAEVTARALTESVAVVVGGKNKKRTILAPL